MRAKRMRDDSLSNTVHQRVRHSVSPAKRGKLMLLNHSITVQFTLVFVIALLLVIGSFYLVLDNVYRSELKSQAETVADNVDAFGSWVSHTAGCG